MWPALVFALAILVLGVGLVAWYGAEQLIQRRLPAPPATPADFGLPYEDVTFPAGDGLTLHGYWIPPRRPLTTDHRPLTTDRRPPTAEDPPSSHASRLTPQTRHSREGGNPRPAPQSRGVAPGWDEAGRWPSDDAAGSTEYISQSSSHAPRPTPHAIVVCHGYNGSLDADLNVAPWLARVGYGVLFFDFRGHGRSEGDLVSLGVHERADLLGAVDWLVGRGVQRVGVLGFSMGAAVAIAAAPSSPHIAVVVADGAFAETRTVVAARLRETFNPGPLTGLLTWAILQAAGWRVGGSLTRAEPLRVVGAVAPRALLLIHGAQDTYVPMNSIRQLYRAARSPKALWVVPEASHREAARLRPHEYQRRVLDFFATYL